jgi:uncharacterized iron-regulated membrane protein
MSLLLRVLDRPGAVESRRWVVQAHLWVGLTVGIVISLLGVSGSLIVFRQEIYRAANAPLTRVEPTGTPKSLQEQAEQAMRANPGAGIDFIELPQDASDATEFSLEFGSGNESRNLTAYLNPYTAEVLAGTPRRLRWLDWLVRLHHNLLAGRTGRVIEGVVSVFFLWLCISGMVIWWPGRPHWKRNLTFNGRLRGWPLALSVHKAVGIWAVLILGMFALTGISFTWNVSKIVYWVTGSSARKEAPVETDWKSGNALLPIDTYLESLRQAVPQGQPVYVAMPGEENRFVRIGFRMRGDLGSEGAENSLYLSPGTGAVLRKDLARDEPWGERVQSSFEALHFGRFGIGPVGDLPVKIVWVVMGMVPGVLFYTGFVPWWNRAIKKRWAGRNV